MQETSKVCIVTGGSRGLGAAIVRHLLEQNHIVITVSRYKTEIIKNFQKEFENTFKWESLDITNRDDVAKFVKKVAQTFKRIDVLVNNAGVLSENLLVLTRPGDIDKVIDINLKSIIHMSQVCSKIMLRQQSGSIINISSVTGLRGYKGLSLYSATKSAIEGFSRSLARELGKRNIRVNVVAPGHLATEMTSHMAEGPLAQVIRRTPLGRLGTPEDVAGVVEFLISPAAKFITGHTLVVDGGFTC